MGFLENIRATASETRTIGGTPWTPWESPLWPFSTGGPAHPSRMGDHSPEGALGLPALYAGSKLLADGTASLPLRVYQSFKGNDGFNKHKIYEGPTIFDSPSLLGTPFDWFFSCMTSLVLQGNSWGFITGRDGYGVPTGIEWIPPDEVYVEENNQKDSWNPLKKKVYVYGRQVEWRGPDKEIFHVKAFSLPGRLEGISLLKAFALTITAGREAQRYGTDWYQAGGFPPGTFQNSEIEIDKTQAAEIRASLVESLRRRQPLVYGRDWDYKPVTVPPSEAQFIEAMQLNATQIASILCLPANRLGGTDGSNTYSNQEQSALQIIEALRPWLVRLEQAFFELVPRNRFTKFNADALLKTDLQTRMQIYQIQRNIGIRSADEIRAEEDLPPLPGGVGTEPLPLLLLNSLGARAGVIPKSIMKSVVLEMDLAAERLKKLENTYVNIPVPVKDPQTGQPTGQTTTQRVALGGMNATPPFAQDPASYLASLITIARDYDQPEENRRVAEESIKHIMERADNIANHEGDDNLEGHVADAPWMNSQNVREIISDHIDLDKRPEIEE